jgi:hypothetical protein
MDGWTTEHTIELQIMDRRRYGLRWSNGDREGWVSLVTALSFRLRSVGCICADLEGARLEQGDLGLVFEVALCPIRRVWRRRWTGRMLAIFLEDGVLFLGFPAKDLGLLAGVSGEDSKLFGGGGRLLQKMDFCM